MGLGSVTDCCLWSLGDLRQHTELHYVDCNQNKLNLYRYHYPLITYLSIFYRITYSKIHGEFNTFPCMVNHVVLTYFTYFYD